ncbi:MAG TPA: prolyl oligopeptidase family serine peptidase [Vicinamibacterales bacterium]|nr:prolyl oligopeptidase family serine peptidase [Vicinamibacterales bacterium]
MKTLSAPLTIAAALLLSPLSAHAQGTAADYERANGLRETYQALALHVPEPAHWIGKTDRFWYRRSVKGGHEFLIVDAATRARRPAFDHERLAAGLSKADGEKHTAVDLGFGTFTFEDQERSIQFSARGDTWRCDLKDYVCRKQDRRGRDEWSAGPGRSRFGDDGPRPSPDKQWEAFIQNYNVAIRKPGSDDFTMLSTDGSEGNYYELRSIVWAPDSKKLAAYRIRPGYKREVHYVESSPEDQIQPKHSTRLYAKPGDVLNLQQPVIFHIDPVKAIPLDNTLFPNPYELSRLEWRKDSRAITFEYNQRGHQVYRVIEATADTGTTRAVIDEQAKTFFCYSCKKFREDVDDGREIVWMSERDGWNHLYLYDGATGEVKNQITKGEWVVRSVEKVDPVARQIWFGASGMYPGQDPYFVNYYRINFDGSGLTRLTAAEANHDVAFSDDMKYFVDTYSRVDMAPVSELRKTSDGSLVEVIERADLTQLTAAGWKPPEVFVAKGRDGTTDIWGVIYRPTNFDPSNKYPVIENIYAGPHSSFVPKSFSAYNSMQALAELGFVVVQIDGMGTSNRSKAFHDVAWKNLKDAGFPDRILWHKAAAAKYPWYDITRVGIYGTSAGGQSSLGALLFHPEFYKVAVSASGCHDNRMDKIWWNEQWMGWPIGPQYAESSNVDNAYRLQGDVLLIVGEMDTNVDPSSTMQVVNQLIKHDKNFDLLVIPGADHTSGGEYGEHKRRDFFVKHLLGVDPPRWKATTNTTTSTAGL